MADIFREVDEEVRREKAAEFWAKYQNWIIALALLVVIGAGGWRYIQYENRKAAELAGQRFEDAMQLARAGKGKEAEQAFAAIAANGPSGYALLARFHVAAETGKTDAAAGARLFDAIADDASVDATLRDAARLRAGMLLVDTAPLADLRKKLEPLAGTGATFRNTAREALALAAIREGDYDAASKWIDEIITDAGAPQNLRQRAVLLQGLTAAGKPPAK